MLATEVTEFVSAIYIAFEWGVVIEGLTIFSEDIDYSPVKFTYIAGLFVLRFVKFEPCVIPKYSLPTGF